MAGMAMIRWMAARAAILCMAVVETTVISNDGGMCSGRVAWIHALKAVEMIRLWRSGSWRIIC